MLDKINGFAKTGVVMMYIGFSFLVATGMVAAFQPTIV
jgi:hypothetical protein